MLETVIDSSIIHTCVAQILAISGSAVWACSFAGTVTKHTVIQHLLLGPAVHSSFELEYVLPNLDIQKSHIPA